MSKTSSFPVQEDQEPFTLGVLSSEFLSPEDHRKKLGPDEPEISGNDGNPKDETSEKPGFEIRRKRRRSEEEDDEDDDADDGFKTPTRRENKIPEVRECPPAPRKPRPESSVFSGIKRASCRRRLEFSPEEVDSFIIDLQRKTMTEKKTSGIKTASCRSR